MCGAVALEVRLVSHLDDPSFRDSLLSATDLAAAAGHQLPPAHAAVLDAIAGAASTQDARARWGELSSMPWPKAPSSTVLLVCGRRWGKSFVSTLQMIFDSLTAGHWQHVLPGQRLYFAIVCPELRQARESARALEHWAGVLRPLGIELERRDVEGHVEFTMTRPRLPAVPVFTIFTASATSFRGYPIAGLTIDEAGHLSSEEGNPSSAREILMAARPALLQFAGTARTIVAGTPGVAAGLHYDWAAKPPKGALRVTAPTWTNGLITRERCEAEALDDRHFRQEFEVSRWGARDEACVERWQVRACVDEAKVAARPPSAPRCISLDYAPKRDGTAIAICRLEYRESSSGDSMPVPVVIVERVEELQGAPSQPVLVADVVDRVIDLRRAFKGVVDTILDMYTATEFEAAFRKIGIKSHQVDMGPRAQTARWLSLFGLIRSRRIVLPPGDRIVDQIAGLRMTELASGSLRVEGKGRSKDDVADAICLGAWRALSLPPSGGAVECIRTPVRRMSEGMIGGERRWFRIVNGRRVPMTPPVGTAEHTAYAENARRQGISTPSLERYWAANGGNEEF